ncbi:MAG: radical SAM protein [Phycisphaerae bacterium]
MKLLQFLADNKDWLFSGAGITALTLLVLVLRRAVRMQRSHTELSSKNQYLSKIYYLYGSASRQDAILTCTSSWPIDRSRSRVLRDLAPSAVAFLGPIRTGSKFVGVLWRLGISLQRTHPFVFHHREHPGLKFVVVGDHVVLSDSRDETPSSTGTFCPEFRDLANMFRSKFAELRRESVPLEDHLCDLIILRLKTSSSASLHEILDFLTNRHEPPEFPREIQVQTLSRYLRRLLPRRDLLYIEAPGQAPQIIHDPSKRGTNEPGHELPALRIVLTQECNFDCRYCPDYNENYPAPGPTLPLAQISYFVKIAKSMGFCHYRFTGGEPLKDPHSFLRCVRDNDLGQVPCTISLATNGSYLKECQELLASIKNLRLKVSLDTMNPERYKEITRVDGKTLQDVLDGLELIDGHHVVGINTVVTQVNQCDIDALIDYCSGHGFYLKIMDLNWYGDLDPQEYWRENFVPLSAFRDRFREAYQERAVATTVGGYGIPMNEFQLTDSSFIRIKDHTLGSTYSPFCKTCEFFPCQEGVYQLTLTSDGKLKVCRHRDRDTAIDVSQALAREDEVEVRQAIRAQVDRFFTTASFCQRKEPFAPS